MGVAASRLDREQMTARLRKVLRPRQGSSINLSRYIDSERCIFLQILLDRNHTHVVSVSLFDENLFEHISHELADHVGRESDTS